MATTITFDYPSMNISNIINDTTKNYWVSGTCNPPSNTTNITYSVNGASATFTATQMWIVGPENSNLHNVPGASFNGELIIQNTSANGTFYMCFLLASSPLNALSDIDNLFNSSNAFIDINLDIVPTSGNNSFMIYTISVDNYTIAVYTSPIPISANLFKYQNNLTNIAMTGSDMITISNDNSSEWMECDNVPIGADTVATYNLPIYSGLVKDINTLDSFKTIVMFIIFFLSCVFCYFLIPTTYLAFIDFIMGNRYYDPNAKKQSVKWIDFGLTAFFVGMAIILIITGLSVKTNSGDLILTGIIFGMIYLIGYIIIQSKKMAGRFIEGVRYDYL